MGKKVLACAICVGLISIFLSSNYARGFGLRQGPLPFEYPLGAIAAFIITGILLMVAVMLRPSLFWPLLIATATATSGMFVLGFPIFDEWLAGCIAIGGATAAMNGHVPPLAHRVQRLWIPLFLLFILYLLLQSIVGLLLYQNLKAVRFILIFVVVFSIALLLSNYRFPQPTSRSISLIVAASGATYLILYILHGFLFRDLVYVYNMDGVGGAGAAYALFPVVVAVPAAILLLHYESGRLRLLAWLTIVLACLVSILGDSRAGFMSIIVSLMIAVLAVGFKPALKLCLSVLLVLTIIGTLMLSNPYYVRNIYEEIRAALQVQEGVMTIEYFGKNVEVSRGDTARVNLTVAAINTIMDNPVLLLFGAGLYGYWSNAGTYYDELTTRYGARGTLQNYASVLGRSRLEPARPPAWPALIVETGVVGVLLMLANTFAAVSKTIFRKSPSGTTVLLRSKLLIVAPFFSTLLWGVFGEIQDNTLFYLMLMPFGLIDSWGRDWEYRGP